MTGKPNKYWVSQSLAGRYTRCQWAPVTEVTFEPKGMKKSGQGKDVCLLNFPRKHRIMGKDRQLKISLGSVLEQEFKINMF